MVVNTALPWDLELCIGGQNYKTRPLRVVDLIALQKFGEMSDDEGFALLSRFFVSPGPELKALSDNGTIGAVDLLGIADAMAQYFKVQQAKNSQAIAETIKAAMAKN